MKMTFRTAAALGVMLLGGLSLGVARAHAGGCGGEHAGDEHGRVYLPASPGGSGSGCGGRCPLHLLDASECREHGPRLVPHLSHGPDEKVTRRGLFEFNRRPATDRGTLTHFPERERISCADSVGSLC